MNASPQQIKVDIDFSKDWVMCQKCGGRGMFIEGAFCPKKQPLIGVPPQVFPVKVVICSECGTPIRTPWKTEGDIKEAS